MLHRAQLTIVACASLLLALSGTVAQSPPPADPLIGIWASETTFTPALRGELVITRNGSDWRARIGSVEAPVHNTGDSVRFAFPSDLGQFRGILIEHSRSIKGFWIQPAGMTLGNAYASPLILRSKGVNLWSAEVAPLEDTYALFLVVSRNSAGSMVGVFRNPERNHSGGASEFAVRRVRDSVFVTARPDTTKPEIRYAVRFDTTQLQLSLFWPPIGQTLVLTPRRHDQAVGLFPRLPSDGRYTYAPPVAEDDGWQSLPAHAVGFDEQKLQTLVQRIADTLPTLPKAPLIHSLLIARNGKLVLEEYFAGFQRDFVHDTRSAAKTFTSVLLGAAMLGGAGISPETPIASVLGYAAPFANPDPRKQRITLANLMTHSSGLACDDNDDASPGNENTMWTQSTQPDFWKFMLDLPMSTDPGTRYAYCSGGMNLAGGALTVATKTWLPELFDRTLARPLQFGRYYFNLSPALQGYLGGGMRIRSRDFLKVGQLYLNGGIWNGKRIVTQSWVTRSTSKQIYGTINDGDGYAWHRNTLKSGTRTYREYEANGNGGQFLIVVPELDLAVVFTAGNYGDYRVWRWFRDDLVANAIIPAIAQ
ncbi:MAG: serine hydrolase domain-containing protein [Gemmatimonadaceae bacterium]